MAIEIGAKGGIRSGKRYPDVGHGVFSIAGLRYSKQIENVIAAANRKGYVLPTTFQLKCLNTYISDLVSNGILSKADLLYFFGWNHPTAQPIDVISDLSTAMRNSNENRHQLAKFINLNLVNPSQFECVNSLEMGSNYVSTTNRGLYKISNNAPNYFATGYDPSVNAINFALNNASITAYISLGEDGLNVTNGSTTISGVVSDTNIGIKMNPWNGLNARTGNLNNTTSENYGTSVTNQANYHHFERTASNALAWYVDGVLVQSRSSVSTAIQSGDVRLIRRFSNSLGFFRLGASLGSSLQKIDKEIFTSFRTKLGYQ